MILSFRPLMGIILFNLRGKNVALHTIVWFSFRPLMGIILFNLFENTKPCNVFVFSLVSVP